MSKLSIITVNYNNEAGLKKTVDSVQQQTFSDYEYIIIDGGSNDGSRELIEACSHKLQYWISERDKGVYDAMNKGIVKAEGDYLLFLNSGDYLCDDLVLDRVFSAPQTHDILYGNIIWSENGNYTDCIFPSKLTFEYFANNSLPHQGSFIARKLFSTVGLYDDSYKIISDWKFFLLAVFRFNCSYKHLNIMISCCGRDGLSCDPANWAQIVQDRQMVIEEYFSAFSHDIEALVSSKRELQEAKSMLGYKLHKAINKLLHRD